MNKMVLMKQKEQNATDENTTSKPFHSAFPKWRPTNGNRKQ